MVTTCIMADAKKYLVLFLLNYLMLYVDVSTGFGFPGHTKPQQIPRLSIWAPPEPRIPSSKPVLNYRLPTSLKPVHYDVELKPNIYSGDSKNFQVNGSVSIHIDVLEDTSVITLHSDWLNITQSSVYLVSDQSATPRLLYMNVDSRTQMLVIYMDGLLFAGSRVILSMQFTSTLRTDGNGFYVQTYTDRYNTPVYLAATLMQATYARTAFPCFDEPAMKATFNITLLRKINQYRNYTTLSNTDVIETQLREDGYVADVHAKTPVMSTYLVAFVVSDFQHVETTVSNGVRNIKFRTWSRRNLIENANQAHHLGMRSYSLLENYFDPPYPIPKLDNIALPNFNSEMENWGLVTYREGSMYRPGFTTTFSYTMSTLVIAHELAHQWFGNLVSPRWWSWLWLNESFATYWERKIINDMFPKQREMDQFLVEVMHGAMLIDSSRSSHPLNYIDMESREQIEGSFDGITYHKGGAIARMLSLYMGETLFIQALNRYLTKHQYGVVDDHDLWNALSEESYSQHRHINLTDVMDTWVTQMNFPLVHVTRVRQGVIHVMQERFLHGREERRKAQNDTATYNYLWEIPITYTSSLEKNFRKSLVFENRKWLSKTHKEDYVRDVVFPCTTLTDSWVYVNTENHFYRVNYDNDNWKSLIKQLDSNFSVIPPIHRAQLIHDSWFIAEAGKLDHSIALQVLNHLKHDVDYIPWVALQHFVFTINSHLQKSVIYQLFREFMVKLSRKAFAHYGVVSDDSDLTIHRLQRSRIMKYACYFGNNLCLQQTTALFREWIRTDNTNLIHPDLRRTIYCNGVRYGNARDFQHVLMKYRALVASQKVEDVTQKFNLLNALACTREPWRIINLFQKMLSSNAEKKNDVDLLLQAMGENPYTRVTAWDTIKRNYDVIVRFRMHHHEVVSRLIVAVTSSFNTYTRYNEIRYFMKTHNVAAHEQAFKHALKRILHNIQWMNKHYDVIRAWLTQRRNK